MRLPGGTFLDFGATPPRRRALRSRPPHLPAALGSSAGAAQHSTGAAEHTR
eukprot:gene20705-biopygen22137